MDETASTPVPATAEGAPAPQAVFDGRRGPLFRLLLINLLLTIITIGIYRFWAKTRVRRYFWRHTRLMGDPLEYLGTGGELFVGFLIAIVFLVPMGGIYSLLQFFLIGTPGYLPIVVDVAYYTLILFLIQVAIHRMRRYRLTRTAWRGIRFGLGGSSLRYALISFGYGFLSIITLSVAHPWLRVATLRYFFAHATFGNASMTLDARAGWLLPRWLIVAVPFAIAVAVLIAVNWSTFQLIMSLNEMAAEGEDVSDQMSGAIASMSYWPLAIIVLSSVIGVWYDVVEFRYLLSHVHVGGANLRSEIGAGFVYLVYFLFWFLFLAAGAALIGGAVALAPEPGSPSAIPAVLAAFSMIGFLALLALTGILRTLLVDVTLLKRVCATLSIDNPRVLEEVIQASAELPRHGEGLADALDVGGF